MSMQLCVEQYAEGGGDIERERERGEMHRIAQREGGRERERERERERHHIDYNFICL